MQFLKRKNTAMKNLKDLIYATVKAELFTENAI